MPTFSALLITSPDSLKSLQFILIGSKTRHFVRLTPQRILGHIPHVRLHPIRVDRPGSKDADDRSEEDCRDQFNTRYEDDLLVRWNDDKRNEINERGDGEVRGEEIKDEILSFLLDLEQEGRRRVSHLFQAF
jgi:hypothetical protein